MALTTSGTLGIGTSTIGSTLQVNGNAAIGYSASTAAPTNGLAVAGNLYVGTTTPVWNAAYNIVQIGATGAFRGSTGDILLANNITFNTSWTYASTGFASAINQDTGGNFLIYTVPSGTSGAAATLTERLRLTNTGTLAVGTSSPDASAILQAVSTTKGFLPPVMTTTQKNAISSPAAGLIVFDSTLAKLCVYASGAWQTITSV
jgi:hypothetical protein